MVNITINFIVEHSLIFFGTILTISHCNNATKIKVTDFGCT